MLQFGERQGALARLSSPETAMSPSVLVFGRRQEGGATRSTDRRPKSAKARSRGKLGTGSAAGAFDQEPGSDRPDLVWPQRRFGSDQLSLVPGCPAGFGGEAFFVRHDRTPRVVRVS